MFFKFPGEFTPKSVSTVSTVLACLGALAYPIEGNAAELVDGPIAISTMGENSKSIQAISGDLKLSSENGSANMSVDTLDVDGGQEIISISLADRPNHSLNIQNGKLEFSEVSPSWFSAHWLVQKTDAGFRLINRWKPAFAVGRNEKGDVMVMSATSEATLWKMTQSEGIDLSQDSKEVNEELIVDRTQLLTTPDFQNAANVSLGHSSTDHPGEEHFLQILEIEPGIYRLYDGVGQLMTAVNIQNGDLALTAVGASWWSGHWVSVIIENLTGELLLQNRWKPEHFLKRNPEGGMEVSTIDFSQPIPEEFSWRIIERSKLNQIRKARIAKQVAQIFDEHIAANEVLKTVEVVAKDATIERTDPVQTSAAESPSTSSANATPSQPSQAVEVATIKKQSAQSPGAESALRQGAEKAQEAARKVRVVAKKKPAPAPKKKARPAPVPKKKTEPAPAPKKKVAPKPVLVANLKPAPKKEVKEPFWKKIRGEISANNKSDYAVGPWQTYLKLYSNNLLGFGETLWVMGDLHSLGSELAAFRAGFDLPIKKEWNWFLRYAGHFPTTNPTPVEGTFQRLELVENEHNLELFKVTQSEGHRNETGVFFNYLNTSQVVLALNETEAVSTEFSHRDIGLFTLGYFWGEDETIKYNGSYRLLVSKGLNVLGASETVSTRAEGEVFPLVVEGKVEARQYWKQSRWHVAASAGFQYADRPVEWHKHFGLGGTDYAIGFPAAETAGEIGAGVYLEVGRSFDFKPSVKYLPETVTFTPYIRGDVAFVKSLADVSGDELNYVRDGLFTSANAGIRIVANKWEFDVGYGLPISGESRFDDSSNGRFIFSATARW